mgnify:CR=1 FL=1
MSSKEISQKAAPTARNQLFDFLYKWGMLLTVVALIAGFGLASDSFCLLYTSPSPRDRG